MKLLLLLYYGTRYYVYCAILSGPDWFGKRALIRHIERVVKARGDKQ